MSNPTPFKGGTLSAVPVAVELPLATGGTGAWALPWMAYPAGVPTGFAIYYQAVTADGAAIKGASISNLLRSTAP